MAKTKIPHVLLLIDRDASTKIPTEVPEYEQVILEEIYGEDLVFEQSSRDVEIEDFDPQKAFDGLVTKYQATAEGDRARKQLYPKLRDLERRLKSAGVKVGKVSDKGEGSDDESLSSGTIAQITATLGDLSDEELDQLEADEKSGKDRAGVHAAIEAEREKRTGDQ